MKIQLPLSLRVFTGDADNTDRKDLSAGRGGIFEVWRKSNIVLSLSKHGMRVLRLNVTWKLEEKAG